MKTLEEQLDEWMEGWMKKRQMGESYMDRATDHGWMDEKMDE